MNLLCCQEVAMPTDVSLETGEEVLGQQNSTLNHLV